MNLRQLLHELNPGWYLLGVIALAVAAWFAVIVHRGDLVVASIRDEARSCAAVIVAKDLIYTTNSTRLDGTSTEFTRELANILEPPAVYIDRPWPGDPRGSVRVILTNGLGQALHMLLQDEYASDGFRFRLLSYRKTTQPVASPNGGPTTSIGNSGASEGRRR
jgi:hypothetical protein